MALSVATNTSAATAHRYLKTNDMEASRSLAKLSSGSRIVRASDDAASLAVGTKLKADVNALRQAQVNASHGSSVLQVADGALQQVSDILIRMKALATQAVTGSISDTERGYSTASSPSSKSSSTTSPPRPSSTARRCSTARSPPISRSAPTPPTMSSMSPSRRT